MSEPNLDFLALRAQEDIWVEDILLSYWLGGSKGSKLKVQGIDISLYICIHR